MIHAIGSKKKSATSLLRQYMQYGQNNKRLTRCATRSKNVPTESSPSIAVKKKIRVYIRAKPPP